MFNNDSHALSSVVGAGLLLAGAGIATAIIAGTKLRRLDLRTKARNDLRARMDANPRPKVDEMREYIAELNRINDMPV